MMNGTVYVVVHYVMWRVLRHRDNITMLCDDTQWHDNDSDTGGDQVRCQCSMVTSEQWHVSILVLCQHIITSLSETGHLWTRVSGDQWPGLASVTQTPWQWRTVLSWGAHVIWITFSWAPFNLIMSWWLVKFHRINYVFVYDRSHVSKQDLHGLMNIVPQITDFTCVNYPSVLVIGIYKRSVEKL